MPPLNPMRQTNGPEIILHRYARKQTIKDQYSDHVLEFPPGSGVPTYISLNPPKIPKVSFPRPLRCVSYQSSMQKRISHNMLRCQSKSLLYYCMVHKVRAHFLKDEAVFQFKRKAFVTTTYVNHTIKKKSSFFL